MSPAVLRRRLPLGRRILLAGAAGLALAGGLPRPRLHAELYIPIDEGIREPLPIAITDFHGESEAERTVGRDLASVISGNLERCGLFRPINPNSFIQDPASIRLRPRFADWRIINAQGLVSGTVSALGDGRLRVEFRLWDVIAEQQVAGLAYSTEPENWRRIAHIVSDAIFTAVTGEDGFFDTRIVYIAESGPATERIKRLAIMDQDGANHRFLTNDSSLVLTPRFSPTTQEITYLAYYNRQPRVYLLNIDSGRQEVLGEFPNMSFAPRFSPDGNRVIMSLALAGNTDIHVMDLRTRALRRLTSSPGIDTSASYAPDGSRIVFESDRGGSQQLYVMNADGANPTRISFGNGRYAEPVWSPRGDLIAFTRIGRGGWAIGVMRPDGTGERILQEGYQVEGPTWAPNGRYIMYFVSRGEPRLRAVDLTGQHSWTVPTPVSGSDPAWSPLIP
ncbi:MAG: Tol-Pal system protein TolB [Alphaproteobacteria bacterium]|jgi:TolB protein|nr:Tol-Pal system protein TolB [Alphaproteobacteria bacterium]